MKTVRMESRAPTHKVWASTAGASVGSAIAALLIVYFPESIPSTAEVPIAAIITAILTLMSGYFKRPGGDDRVVESTSAGPAAGTRLPA